MIRMFAKSENGKFRHIYPSATQVGMYTTDTPVPVNVSVDANGDYWGWQQKSGYISMIYEQEQALEICFPYGTKVAEERGDGKRVKLTIQESQIIASQ